MPTLRDVFRTAIAVVLFLAIASLFTHNASSAGNTKSTAPARGYYLTTESYQGDHHASVCAAGYHMASYGEVSDLSNLRYDKTLGRTTDDSGDGPPLDAGWIRGGASSSTGGIGANCGVWSSNSGSDYGTGLQTLQVEDRVFKFGTTTCNSSLGVWCVQD